MREPGLSPTTSTGGPARSSSALEEVSSVDRSTSDACPSKSRRRVTARASPLTARRSCRSRARRICSSPATTTARSRRSSRTPRRPARCPSRSPRSARSPILPDDHHRRRSPAARCATSPTLSRLPAEVHLVGSHGSEFDVGFVHTLTGEPARAAQPRARGRAASDRRRRAGRRRSRPSRPASPCTSAAPTRDDAAARCSPRSAPARVLARRPRHRGQGGRRAGGRPDRQGRRDRRCCATRSARLAALFVGDDVTDEKAFARLSRARPRRQGRRRPDPRRLPRSRPGRGRACCSRCSLEERRTWLHGEPGHADRGPRCSPTSGSVALITPDATPHLAVPPRARLAGGVRRAARRRGGRLLRGPRRSATGCRSASATCRHDDRPRPAGRGSPSPTTSTAATRATTCTRHRPGPRDLRRHPRRGRVRAAARLRRRLPGAARSPAADGLKVVGTSDPIVLRAPGRRVGDPPPTACTRPRRRGRPAAPDDSRSCSSCAAAPTTSTRTRSPELERAAAGHRAVLAGLVGDAARSRRSSRTWSCARR